MTYRLVFKVAAKKEWDKLDSTLQELFKALAERLENPRVESSRLDGLQDCYKIKLHSAGYYLVYQVRDSELAVSVLAVGKRERNAVYKATTKRI